MSKKSAKIAALIEGCRGHELDAHYLGYFECFNRGLFYEAHDVLEELWLADRHGPDGDFYKGLIQFAGAFVHLQKHTALRPRLRPSAALFKLARTNLAKYPPVHHQLDLTALLRTIEEWLARLEGSGFEINPLEHHPAPSLKVRC
jgi:predicted metal-dependent hydrolase